MSGFCKMRLLFHSPLESENHAQEEDVDDFTYRLEIHSVKCLARNDFEVCDIEY